MTTRKPPCWRKSSHSDADGNCVEVARASGGLAVRDSKDPAAGHLSLTAGQFAGLVAAARAGTLDVTA